MDSNSCRCGSVFVVYTHRLNTMMWQLFVLLIAVPCSVLGAPSSQSSDFVEECNYEFQVFKCIFDNNFKFNDGTKYDLFLENEEELDKMCKSALPMNKCLGDAFRDCDSKKNPYFSLFPDIHALLKKLCDRESSLRKTFLKNAKCISDNRSTLSPECSDIIRNPESDFSKEEHCKTYRSKLDACSDLLKDKCGEEAKDMAMEIYKPYVGFYRRTCPSGSGIFY